MEYREATDILAKRATLEEVAAELGVSVQSLKQARLDPESTGYRTPPPGWQGAVAAVATRHAADLQALARALRSE